MKTKHHEEVNNFSLSAEYIAMFTAAYHHFLNYYLFSYISLIYIYFSHPVTHTVQQSLCTSEDLMTP